MSGLAGDQISNDWLGQIVSMREFYVQGEYPYVSPQALTPERVLERTADTMVHLAPHLPARTSPALDYQFNNGRYVFALGENRAVRGIVAIRLFPNRTMRLSLLRFMIGPPTGRPERSFRMELFHSNGTTITRARRPDLDVELTDARKLRAVVDYFLNDFIALSDDEARERQLRGTRRAMTSDVSVKSAMNAGAALVPFLQIYESVHVEMTEFSRANKPFFGSQQAELQEALQALMLIRELAELLNRPGEPSAAALLQRIRQSITGPFLAHLVALLNDDYGYETLADALGLETTFATAKSIVRTTADRAEERILARHAAAVEQRKNLVAATGSSSNASDQPRLGAIARVSETEQAAFVAARAARRAK